MAKIENLEILIDKLRERRAKARDDEATGVVGYTAKTALWVHENREMKLKGKPRPGKASGGEGKLKTDKQRKWFWAAVSRGEIADPRGSGLGVYWGPHGRAGFLLDVAREMQVELKRVIITAMKSGVDLGKAILLACLRLQRESMKNVPVEYGNLRASAFTRLER